jgi:hypothetical protein
MEKVMNAQQNPSLARWSNQRELPQLPRRRRRRSLPVGILFALCLALCGFGPPAVAQTDDFNDGNDTGWTRMNPLAGLPYGGTGTWSFPGGAYRIQAAASLAPQTAGPGRAGSIINNVNLTNFYLTCDIVDWDNSLDQIFGLLARVGNVGLGQTRGYAFTYATRAGRAAAGELQLLLINGEQGNEISGAALDFTMQPDAQYRLVFIGNGGNLTGQVFALPDLSVAVATLNGIDYAHAAGGVGIFTYDNSPSASSTADTTFDNFLASPAPPPRMAITKSGNQITLSWPGEGFILQSTPQFPPTTWNSITTGITQESGLYVYRPTGSGRGYYRLKWP